MDLFFKKRMKMTNEIYGTSSYRKFLDKCTRYFDTHIFKIGLVNYQPFENNKPPNIVKYFTLLMLDQSIMNAIDYRKNKKPDKK